MSTVYPPCQPELPAPSLSAPTLPALILIAGPTASGKSQCAVRLAEALRRLGRRAVVINADSAQIYADLAVLSARPTVADMAGIEHRLYGAWDGAMACSAADWAVRARAEIAAVHAQDALPIVVGGTGLYLRTLLEGIAPVPAIDEDIRRHVRAMTAQDLYAALVCEDRERASLLHPSDVARLARALEVVRSTGYPLAHWHQRREGGIAKQVRLVARVILPERGVLYQRCDARFTAMLGAGAIEEVQTLLARELDPSLPVMRAIGVRDIAHFLNGRATLNDVSQAGAQATRNYAKRQLTWLRHQSPADWEMVANENNIISDISVSLCL